jgi:hypothetical protein
MSYPDLAVDALLPGDVCLMLGAGEVSKMIAWAGDAIYSHAFIIYDQTRLAEAALSGLRLYPIADRIADTKEALIMDVYRPSNRDGKSYSDAEVQALRHSIDGYLGRPYAKNQLAELGMVCAMRNKLPDSEAIRWLIHVALSHLLKDDPSHMVCSEFVYRVLQEANTQPAGNIRPTIIQSFKMHTPFPQLDIKAFIKEMEAIIMPPAPIAATTGTASETPPNTAPPVPTTAALAAYQNAEPLGSKLDELIQVARSRFLPPQASSSVLIVPDPNPKTILPLDLATSPSLRFIGRLAR